MLSAFDSALYLAGVGNYNLIYLSSIIPVAREIVEVERYEGSGNYGDRLYMVKAEYRSDVKGEYIGAGIGWYQFADGSGLFVEHETHGGTEEVVNSELKNLITDSLKDLCIVRNFSFDPEKVGIKINTTQVGDLPRSVLTCAVFKSEEW